MILNDIELCNNIVFLISKNFNSILQKSNDHFWCALSEHNAKSYDNVEIRLEQIQKDDPTYLAGLLIQQQILKVNHSPNSEERYKKIDAEIKERRGGASNYELEYCAIAWFAFGKTSKAIEYLEKSLKKHGPEIRTICIRAAFEPDDSKVGRFIDQIPEGTNSAVGKYFLFEYQLKARQHSTVQKQLEKMIQFNSNFIAGYIQLLKTSFGIQDWDAVNSSATWLVSACPGYYDAYVYLALEALFSVQNDQSGQCADMLAQLLSILESSETEKLESLVKYVRILIFTAGDVPTITDQILGILGKCPETPETMCLYGQFYLQKNNAKKAQEYFNRAMAADSSLVYAFNGLVWCCIKMGNTKKAAQQFEMAKSMFDTSGVRKDLDLYLIELELGSSENKTELLKRAQVEHTKDLNAAVFDINYIEKLNPLKLLQLFEHYLSSLDKDDIKNNSKPAPVLRRAERLIGLLKRSCTNLKSVRISEAKFKILTGKLDDAEDILVSLDPTADIYLVQAALEIERENISNVRRYLDSAIATDFNVQNSGQYQFLAAQCSILNANYSEAIKQLERALKSNSLNQFDQITANLRLAQAYQKNGQFIEAASVTDKMERTYSDGSSIAGRLALSKAEQSLESGDVNSAITILENVKYNSGGAIVAKYKLAEIYLNDRRNEDRFIEIYRELCQYRQGEYEPLVALGDALLRVNRAEDSIKSYEAALRLKKGDGMLQVKIGQAMVITHDYEGAISYYRKSMSSADNANLRLDLAELLQKLGALDDAIEILKEGTEQTDPSTRELQAQCYFNLCKIFASKGQREDALTLLAKAKQITDSLLKKKDQEETESLKILNMEIHVKIADLAQETGDFENATKFYSKAITYMPNSDESNRCKLKLANAFRIKGDHVHAQAVLSKMLNTNLAAEAAEINVDIMCDSGNVIGAIQHYRRLIEKQPNKFDILAKLIPLMRRNGQLAEVTDIIDDMEETLTPGRRFCQGMLDYFNLRTESAMKHLSHAKRSVKWRYPALVLMIKLCLGYESEELNTDKDAVNLAKHLLSELPANDIEAKFLANWILLARNDKNSVTEAISGFHLLEGISPDASLAGMCAGLVIQKKTQVKNQLKRFTTAQWTSLNFEHMEKGNLILAQIYIQNRKSQQAREILDSIVKHNKGSWRALELRALTHEIENDHQKALPIYETAWKVCSENNPAIGYRLAQCYLRNNMAVEAINACQTVLKENPDYPQIRDVIMKPARLQIRR